MTSGQHRGAEVEFRAVSKTYGRGEKGHGAVIDLSLVVPAGSITVLVGPSGCGKTTTLKMVNRLVEPTVGTILLDGTDVRSMPVTELRRRIGYVIQQTGLFPHQTIAENVGTVPRLLGWDRERIRRRVDDLIALVGLNPDKVRSRYPAQLSGGERQRIGVARALAAEPPLMLMDEPFGAVDPIVRSRLQDEFLTFQRHLGVTVLFVTHDIDEAIKLGDRVAVMQEGGRVAQYAAPEDLLAHPADEFVARFVGADRGLKRLSLMRVGDQPLSEAVVAHQGDTADAIRGKYGPDTPWALLLDRDGRPEGWVNLAKLPRDRGIEASDADPTSPILHALTPVRDAFSAMLASAVQTGVVVDDRGLFIGALELETVTELLRRPAVEAL